MPNTLNIELSPPAETPIKLCAKCFYLDIYGCRKKFNVLNFKKNITPPLPTKICEFYRTSKPTRKEHTPLLEYYPTFYKSPLL